MIHALGLDGRLDTPLNANRADTGPNAGSGPTSFPAVKRAPAYDAPARAVTITISRKRARIEPPKVQSYGTGQHQFCSANVSADSRFSSRGSPRLRQIRRVELHQAGHLSQ